MRLLLAALLALFLSGCGNITVQPAQVDFGGTGTSHGRP